MTAAHTPTPWTQRDNDTRVWLVGSDGVNVVATSWHTRTRKPHPLKDEAFANIAVIAKAVNNYAVVEDSLKFIRGMAGYGLNGTGDDEWGEWGSALAAIRSEAERLLAELAA